MARLINRLLWGSAVFAALVACAKAENSLATIDGGGGFGADASVDGAKEAASGGAAGKSSTGGAAGANGGSAGATGGAAGEPGDASTDQGTDAPIDVNPDSIVTQPGLQGFWKFEETTGPVIDSSGNGLHGTVKGVGVTRGTTGKSGNAITFAGGSGSVQIPGNAKLNFTTGATIEFWISLTSFAQGTILARGTGSGDNHVRIVTTQGNVNVSFGGSSPATLISAPNVLTSSWTHIAVVNDGINLKLYVNGKLNMTDTGGGLVSMLSDLFIGKSQAADTAIGGNLDEIKWYNAVRTDQDVCADYGGVWGTVDGAAGCS